VKKIVAAFLLLGLLGGCFHTGYLSVILTNIADPVDQKRMTDALTSQMIDLSGQCRSLKAGKHCSLNKSGGTYVSLTTTVDELGNLEVVVRSSESRLWSTPTRTTLDVDDFPVTHQDIYMLVLDTLRVDIDVIENRISGG
jgi:hypothetical protein